MQVKYAPKVKVSVIGGALSGGRIPEFAQVRLECKADANPGEVRYRWFINDEPIIGGQKTEMVILMFTAFVTSVRAPLAPMWDCLAFLKLIINSV